MQASKIKPKQWYAVFIGEGDRKKLVRFQVTSITTVRTGDSPHDYKSTVAGTIHHLDAPPYGEGKLSGLDPDQILGPYDQHKALLEREATERRAQQEREQQKDADRDVVLAWLYQIAGIEMPQDEKTLKHYTSPFAAKFHGEIVINHNGVQKLLAALLERGEVVKVEKPETVTVSEGVVRGPW